MSMHAYMHAYVCTYVCTYVCNYPVLCAAPQTLKAEVAAREKSVQSVTEAAGQLISSGSSDSASNIQHDVQVLASK